MQDGGDEACRRAEDALKASEELFHTLASMAPAGIYVTDPEGRCVYVNRRWLEMAGLTEDEAMGEGWVRGLHPDDRAAVAAAWQKMVESEGRWSLDYRFQTSGGHVTWVQGVAAPRRDAGGHIVGYIGVNLDITQRKTAEEALKVNDRVFRHAVDLLCVAGFDGYFKALNPSWSRVLGWSTDELLAKPWIEFVHPDDREATLGARALLVDGRELCQFENRYLCQDGSVKWLSWNSYPYPAEGVIYGVARDVTAQKEMELALRDSEEHLRLAAEGANVGLWDWDLRTNALYLSPIWKRQLGYADHEIPNRFEEWADRLHPEDRERALARVKAFQSSPWPNYENEFRLRHKDGSYRWILTKASLVTDAAGVPVRMLGAHLDITDRKETEAALRASERRFHELVENAPDAIFIQTEGRFAYVNAACVRLLGASGAGDIVGRPVPDRFHPDDRARVEARIRGLNEARVVAPAVEEIMLTLSGRAVPVEVSAVPFEYEGRAGALVFVHDISARKAAEQNLQYERDLLHALLDSMPDAIYFKDAQSRFLRVNRAQAARFGLEDPALVEGRTDANYFSPEHAARALADERQIMSTGTPMIGKEEQEMWPDGRSTWVSTTKVPLRDSQGHIVGTLGMSRDITEHKQAELQLKARLEELRRWHEATLGREMRVLELKREVNELLARAGQPPRYPSAQEAPGAGGRDAAPGKEPA